MKIKIIDFYSDSCVPCKRVDEHLKNIIDKYDFIELEKVNVDNETHPLMNLVTALPTLVVLDEGGNIIETIVGALPYNKLRGELLGAANES